MSSLESEIGAALTSETISGDALSDLILRVQEAIVASEAESKRCQEAIYDIDVKDPKAEHVAMEESVIMAGRLQTALTRLHRKRTAVETSSRLAAWESEFNALKDERNALADELVDTYPEAAAKLIDLFSRISAFDGRLSTLRQNRPGGIKAHLADVELEVRGLERFTRDTPSIIQQVLLFDLSTGKQAWPPVVKRDLSFAIPVIDDIRHSPDWWKPEVRNARRAESENEAARVAAFYADRTRQKAEREEREEQQAREAHK